jgi:hypothetical protein
MKRLLAVTLLVPLVFAPAALAAKHTPKSKPRYVLSSLKQIAPELVEWLEGPITGATGPEGPRGLQGEPGVRGPSGERGPEGPRPLIRQYTETGSKELPKGAAAGSSVEVWGECGAGSDRLTGGGYEAESAEVLVTRSAPRNGAWTVVARAITELKAGVTVEAYADCQES